MAHQKPEKLSLDEILFDHGQCVKWARLGRVLKAPSHRWSESLKAYRRQFRWEFREHLDVIEAAQVCCAGHGHH